MNIAFYISGHGFGHASRQIEIINALGPKLASGVSILVRTSAARWLFDRTLRTPVIHSPAVVDTGVVQIDSLRLDEDATVRAAHEFYSTFHRRVEDEAAFIRANEVRLVIADAPPLACAAASAAGIPSILISNFTWDWIYEAYEAFETELLPVLQTIREAYASASAGWRLPMHGGFATFRHIEDLPFVARHATHSRGEVLGALRIPSDRPIVLASFGGYGVDDLDLSTLDCRSDWTVLVTGNSVPAALPHGVAFVEEQRMYDAGFRYEDLVAAVDVVATKPGYGIISECVANDTAMLYTSRGRFPEYEVMVREMPRVLRCAFIDQRALLDGRWLETLTALMARPAPPERPAADGAEVASDRIADMVHRGPPRRPVFV